MPHTLITSVANPKIKALVRLLKKGSDSAFTVEGVREISQALPNWGLLELYFHQQRRSADADAIITKHGKVGKAFALAPHVFSKIAIRANKDGIVAVFAYRRLPLAGLALTSFSKPPLLCVCQELQKPGNLGAMMRTAVAVGCDALIVVDQSMSIYNPNVIRASLGHVFNAPLALASSAEAYDWLCANNINIVLADGLPPHHMSYTAYDFRQATAIVFGSEAEGLSDFWRKLNVTRLYIPMRPQVSSLNVSVCGGIILYEAWRQRSLAASDTKLDQQ
ncbi:MAG: RNA methyltransferase [Pseudomonadota bacterium]|nr:RNA methyltransferase [Pseudomonadota bacterium]